MDMTFPFSNSEVIDTEIPKLDKDEDQNLSNQW